MSYFEERMQQIATNPNLVSKPPKPIRKSLEREKPLVGTRLGFIYFITDLDDDAVKIGFATDIDSRLNGLRTGNPRDLAVETMFCSYFEAEKMLHDRFRPYRIRREWFRLSEEIEEFWDDILDYKGCHGDTSGSGKDFLNSMDAVMFPLEDLKIMLANIGTPWRLIPA